MADPVPLLIYPHECRVQQDLCRIPLSRPSTSSAILRDHIASSPYKPPPRDYLHRHPLHTQSPKRTCATLVSTLMTLPLHLDQYSTWKLSQPIHPTMNDVRVYTPTSLDPLVEVLNTNNRVPRPNHHRDILLARYTYLITNNPNRLDIGSSHLLQNHERYL